MTKGAGALANPNAGYNAAVNAMTPQQQIDLAEAPSNAGGGLNSFLQTFAPVAFEALLDAETAGTLGTALGGVMGAAVGGATAGLENTALQAAQSQKGAGTGANVTLGGAATNVGLGALGGAANFEAKGLTGDLSSLTGLSPAASGALVKGGIGAGMGAITGSLNGTGAGKGALVGGVSGALKSGTSSAGQAAGAATGSSFLGSAAGLAAGTLGAAAVSPLLSSGTGSSGTNATTSNGNQMAITGNNTAVQSGASTTDSSLASTITGALPGVLQAGTGAATSLAASNAQVNADQNAITTQQGNLGNINNIWSTQQQTGQGANNALQSSLGLNGQTANPSNFENMPGYQFAVSQGTQAIQRQAAAMGNAYTPNTAAAVGQYVTGTASQDYNTYISQLMGAAGLGTTANQGLQTGSQQSSNNISQLQQNIGQAQASGISGVGSSVGSLFGVNGAGTGLINSAGSALNGNSSGGSGVSPMNYGGSNPNGTSGNGTSSDPYGANASQYNSNINTGVGNGTFGSGVNPNTGQSYVTDPTAGLSNTGVGDTTTPTVDIDTGDTDDMSNDLSNFLGDW
jgi:hypothetical protein